MDALLAADTDTLTAPDMASRATWADAYRGAGHRETASWHFVDIELDHPDLNAACFSFPAASGPASQGPAQDCVVDKVEEFERELADPSTPHSHYRPAMVHRGDPDAFANASPASTPPITVTATRSSA